MPDKNEVTLTCIFKLHNPSAWRRQAFDYAIFEYERVLMEVLAWAKENDETLAKYKRLVKNKNTGQLEELDSYDKKSLAYGMLPQADIDSDLSGALKESARMLVCQMLVSWFNREVDEEGKPIGWPVVGQTSPHNYVRALRQLALLADDEETENILKAELQKQARFKHIPLDFGKRRDCTILARPDFSAYYALLPVLAPGHDLLINKTRIKNLVDIQTGEIVDTTTASILVPLEIGKRGQPAAWQVWRFLEQVQAGYVSVRTAKLIKTERGEYFLAYNFAFPKPKPYEAEAWLGIDRGAKRSACWGIVDRDGRILKMRVHEDGYRELKIKTRLQIRARQKDGRRVTLKDFRGKKLDTILHEVANEILDDAVSHRAGLVLEDLTDAVNIRGSFYQSAFAKFETILRYKAALIGIPVREVFPAYTSLTCIHCGERGERKDREDRLFTCPACGVQEDADAGASINIARRALYRKKDWQKRGGYRAFHRSFASLPDNKPAPPKEVLALL